jgi:hypothetical protein
MTPVIDEMRAQIHATTMEAAPARPWWQHRRRTGLISGGAVALAAVAAAVVIVVGGGSSAPRAYAAVFHTSGSGERTVTITLREEHDIPQLNARLEAEHTRIRVVPVVRGCDAPVHSVSDAQVVPGPVKTLLARPLFINGKPAYTKFQTIEVNTIAGRTLVVAYSPGGFDQFSGVVVDPVPACIGVGHRFNITS